MPLVVGKAEIVVEASEEDEEATQKYTALSFRLGQCAQYLSHQPNHHISMLPKTIILCVNREVCSVNSTGKPPQSINAVISLKGSQKVHTLA